MDPATKQEFVAVHINHGRDEGWARQAFHDLNNLAIRPNAAISLGMDARDPLTHICREVERKVPFFRDRVNKVRRQLRSTDAEIVTITTLRGACVTLAKGINGVQFGARPVPIAAELVPQIELAAIEWFGALTSRFGPAFENRDQCLAASPTAMAALGAIGHPLVSATNASDRTFRAEELVRSPRNRQLDARQGVGRHCWQVHSKGRVLPGRVEGDCLCSVCGSDGPKLSGVRKGAQPVERRGGLI